MNILKKIMLGLLVTICTVAAAVTVLHFTGVELFSKNEPNTAPLKQIKNNEDADDAGEGLNIPEAIDQGFDYRFWQRVMSKHEDTGLWQYYPLIPYDALPGEKVVLSVSSVGFKGWEADPDFAPVELFDATSDAVNTYISFIMPDDEVSIAALYNEIPYINFENDNNARMSRVGTFEQGSVPIMAADSGIVPQPIVPTRIPSMTVNVPQTVTITNPTIVPEGRRVTWEFTQEVGVVNALPVGLTYRSAGIQGGIIIDGVPTVVGGPVYFYFDLYDYEDYDPLDPDASYYGRYRFMVTILPPSPPPMIETDEVPNGMVGVRYDVPIETAFFPAMYDPSDPDSSAWTLHLPISGQIPNGLSIWRDDNDHSKWAIRGTPTPLALTSGAGGSADHSFFIDLLPTNPEVQTVRSPTYFITIFPQPTIAQPQWRDGMVGQLYNPNYPDIPASVDSINVSGTTGLTGLNPPHPNPNAWGWTRVGDLPEGLRFEEVTVGDATKIAIVGTPLASAEDEEFEITLKFESVNRELIIGETAPITITGKIWPRPVVADQKIFDGMRGPNTEFPPPSYNASSTVTWTVTDEPDEIFRESHITAGRLPNNTTAVLWTVEDDQLPIGLEFDDINETIKIKGTTTGLTKSGDYPITASFTINHDNPNINKAETNVTANIRIWERAYLTGVPQPSERFMPSQVKRDKREDSLGGYETYGRAIIPGEWGTIQDTQTGSDFVRWEISKPAAPLPAGLEIGSNWELTPRGSEAMSFTWIQMPKPASPTSAPINVEIMGWHVGPPLIAATLPIGEIDVSYPGSFRITNLSAVPSVIGTGPVSRSWKLITPGENDRIPPGIDIDPGAGVLYGASSETDTFTFSLELTLAGTMKLIYGSNGLYRPGWGLPLTPFSLFIDIYRPIYGDVDGSGSLDLADLVLLSKFRNGSPAEIQAAREAMELRNSMRNGNIISSFPSDPDGRDLLELERWFVLEGLYDIFMATN